MLSLMLLEDAVEDSTCCLWWIILISPVWFKIAKCRNNLKISSNKSINRRALFIENGWNKATAITPYAFLYGYALYRNVYEAIGQKAKNVIILPSWKVFKKL